MALETLDGVHEINNNTIMHLPNAFDKEDYKEMFNEVLAAAKKEQFIIHDPTNNIIAFKIQDGTIGENDVNGVQVMDMVATSLHIIKGLNAKFPCFENEMAIAKLEEAMIWDAQRTANRVARNVEGKNLQ